MTTVEPAPAVELRFGFQLITIDDDEDHRFLITKRIRAAGFPVLAFESAEDAIAYFCSQFTQMKPREPAWVVFCDLKMPRMSGFDLLRWIRAERAASRIPFYVLSASNQESDREKSAALGASGYLVKFPTAQEFRAIIMTGVEGIVRRTVGNEPA